MFCFKCGSKLYKNVKFCSNCGQRINTNNKFQNDDIKTNIKPISHSSEKYDNTNKDIANPFYYYLLAFKNCFIFSGNANRKEYWFFQLFNIVIFYLFLIVDFFISTNLTYDEFPIFQNLYMLIIFLPTLSITIRRLHDIGRSSWWILTFIIPPWLFALMCFDSKNNKNIHLDNKIKNYIIKDEKEEYIKNKKEIENKQYQEYKSRYANENKKLVLYLA